ncbi:MAG: V-type ATP synthase subunit I, partial [Lachnospiraceae bacterium]
MAILQMQRVSICAMKKDRKSILEQLQAWGVMEVNNSVSDEEFLKKMDTVDARQTFEKNVVLADRALEVLQEYAPEKTNMLSSLKGKALVEKSEYELDMQNKSTIMSAANQLLALQKKIAETKSQIAKLEAQVETLSPWLTLDVPMNYTGTKKTEVLIGAISAEMSLEQIYVQIAEAMPDLENFDIQIVSSDQDQTCIVAISLKEEAGKLEEALRTFGFSKPSQVVQMVPREHKEKLEAEMKMLNESVILTEGKIREYATKREELRIISDYFRSRSRKYEVLGEVLQSQQTFIISG